jgi:hypothetical protein
MHEDKVERKSICELHGVYDTKEYRAKLKQLGKERSWGWGKGDTAGTYDRQWVSPLLGLARPASMVKR